MGNASKNEAAIFPDISGQGKMGTKKLTSSPKTVLGAVRKYAMVIAEKAVNGLLL